MIIGLFGTGAPIEADLNLILQILMGIALTAGALLARGKKYVAHAVCQSTVLSVNAIAIVWLMWPSFQHAVLPRFARRLHRACYLWPALHGFIGVLAELLGIYIALSAATGLLPEGVRLRCWKLWMRLEWSFGCCPAFRTRNVSLLVLGHPNPLKPLIGRAG